MPAITHAPDHVAERPAAVSSLGRRSLLAATGGAVATAAAASRGGAAASAASSGRLPLRFGRDGRFRIVQFNDTQDGTRTDRRTLQLMDAVLEQERPGFALINGDVINGDPRTTLEVKQAVNNVVQPMESRGIPWALTFGNHDEDSLDRGTGLTEDQILRFVRGYRHNLNDVDGRDVYGTSNTQLLIGGSASRSRAVFGLWLLDSNRYAPAQIGGQGFEGLMSYDWIRPDQVQWYRDRSAATARRHGGPVPSLMFFHIPLWQHHHMWFGTQFGSDEATHPAAARKHSIVGEKNEAVFVGAVDSGLYAALQERGDVLGVYCGHDHINTYSGNYFGIELGYGPGTGFGTYGLGGADTHRLRGARVFELDERDERVYTGTRTVFARDLGIDMDPAAQPIDAPLPLPRRHRR